MKVRELIAQLQDYNPEAEVVTEVNEGQVVSEVCEYIERNEVVINFEDKEE